MTAPRHAPATARGTVVVLSSVHWHYTWQRHHEIATRLARRGYDVIWVEPLPKRWPAAGELGRVAGRLLGRPVRSGLVRQAASESVALVSPLLLPDVGAAARALNRRFLVPRLARRLATHAVRRPLVLWHYLPISAALELDRRLAPDLSLYDCVSDWAHHPYARRETVREAELLGQVDLVLADSPYLFARMRELHAAAHRIMPAVDADRFAAARARKSGGNAALCGYFGSLTESVDVGLLAEVGRRHRLRLVGPVQTPLPRFGDRVERIGPVPADRVPELLRDVDVLLLPYRRTAYNRGVMPAKTFECLATGKPTVAIGLDSLRELGDLLYHCEDEAGFLAAVDTALAEDDPALRERRLAAARDNGWDARIDQIEGLLETALARRQPRPDARPDSAAIRERRFPEVRHLGLRIDLVTMDDLTELVDAAVDREGPCVIAHHNLHSAFLHRRRAAMRALYERAAYVHFDGMGLVLSARLAGLPARRRHRVTYADWIWSLGERAAARGWKLFHLGGRPGVGERAARRLEERFPGLRIESHPGYFDAAPTSPESHAVLARIAAAAPQVLLVGMGMPRQERWILDHLERLSVPVVLPCGACFDYVAGELATPPRWAGGMGLEWLFRLAAEPRRLLGRYLLEPFLLSGPWLAETVRRRLLRRGAEPPTGSSASRRY